MFVFHRIPHHLGAPRPPSRRVDSSQNGRGDSHSFSLRLLLVAHCVCAHQSTLSLLTPREEKEDVLSLSLHLSSSRLFESRRFLQIHSVLVDTASCSDNILYWSLNMFVLSIALLSCTTLCAATTEWWGDLRAHLNPARQAPFYDVTYDEKGLLLLS